MGVQGRTDFANYPFILSGVSFVRDSLTLLQDAGRATVLALYTIMARLAVTVPTTGTGAVTNAAGIGTVTAVGLIPGVGVFPRIGTWVLECTAAVANGGTFKLTDPGGNIVRSGLVITAGAGAATVFQLPEVGLKFTITDATTDFSVGETFTIAVTANGKWVPFDADGVNGAEIPAGILMCDSVTAAALVAGDVTMQTMLVGGCCVVDEDQIVIDDGVTTLSHQLTSGKTVREALQGLGIFTKGTLDIDLLEN
jgi:hypothetical protein